MVLPRLFGVSVLALPSRSTWTPPKSASTTAESRWPTNPPPCQWSTLRHTPHQLWKNMSQQMKMKKRKQARLFWTWTWLPHSPLEFFKVFWRLPEHYVGRFGSYCCKKVIFLSKNGYLGLKWQMPLRMTVITLKITFLPWWPLNLPTYTLITF